MLNACFVIGTGLGTREGVRKTQLLWPVDENHTG